jgi:glucuronate isomerase
VSVRDKPTTAAGRYLRSDLTAGRIARELYDGVARLPIVSPHGYVDLRLLADPDATFGTPTELFVFPDHYILRMLYSRGIALERLGLPVRTGQWA